MKIQDEKLTSTVRTKAVAEGDSGEGEEEEDEEDEEDCCDPSPPPKVRCNLSSVAKISRRITSSFSRKALVHSRCWSAIFFSNNRLFFNSCGNEKIFQSVVLQKGLQIGQKHWVDEKHSPVAQCPIPRSTGPSTCRPGSPGSRLACSEPLLVPGFPALPRWRPESLSSSRPIVRSSAWPRRPSSWSWFRLFAQLNH